MVIRSPGQWDGKKKKSIQTIRSLSCRIHGTRLRAAFRGERTGLLGLLEAGSTKEIIQSSEVRVWPLHIVHSALLNDCLIFLFLGLTDYLLTKHFIQFCWISLLSLSLLLKALTLFRMIHLSLISNSNSCSRCVTVPIQGKARQLHEFVVK